MCRSWLFGRSAACRTALNFKSEQAYLQNIIHKTNLSHVALIEYLKPVDELAEALVLGSMVNQY